VILLRNFGHRTALSIGLSVLLLITSGYAKDQKPPTVSNAELAVYAAVLNELSKNGSVHHPLIANRTSSFDCQNICNGMEIAGCSGMRASTETPKEVLSRVKEEINSLSSPILLQFETKNQTCAAIGQGLPTKTKHHLFSLIDLEVNGLIPKEWTHPDYLYFSRVAFDKAGRQALVYLGLMSGSDGTKSAGLYIQLNKVGVEWKMDSTVSVWTLNAQ
jgi:hypothetical protein